MPDFARRLAVFSAALLALMILGCASMQNVDLGAILGGRTGQLDEPTVLAGLKEALRVGSENTVASTSTVDGFLGNALIRIAMPDQLDGAASTLRKAGLGGYVDELETAMNRAAEQAAGEARGIFWSAITAMTIEDAFAILRGHETAATDYFRSRTESDLRARFAPIVAEKTESVGLGRLYGQLTDTYGKLPLTSKPALVDLDAYVTDEALDGLFTVLAREEQAIRQDPAARTTELLRRVFGG
ncbi:MAG: DUF4197 domain-containing protein [bacterium]|nr:DUF4197 domain-containing protein [bacterium]